MKCDILTSCVIITKDDKYQHYVIEDGISLKELNIYFTNKYKENLDKVILGQTFGYLHNTK